MYSKVSKLLLLLLVSTQIASATAFDWERFFSKSRLYKSTEAATKAKTLRNSEYSAGGGGGTVVAGVNLYTGQPVQSLPLLGIANGSVSWQFQLGFGTPYAQFAQDNQSAPAGLVGHGWDLSIPGVMVNNKGTAELSDDIYFANLGPYGGGQILVIEENIATKLILASNPAIEIIPTVASTGEYKDQIIAWTFRLPDGKRMLFGNLNPGNNHAYIRTQLKLGSKKEFLTINDNGSQKVDPDSKPLPYRWDLQSIRGTNIYDSLKFDYRYQLSTVNNSEIPSYTLSNSAENTIKNHYVKSGYLHKVSAISKGVVLDQITFEYSTKSSDLYQRSGVAIFDRDQSPVETQQLSSLYHTNYFNGISKEISRVDFSYSSVNIYGGDKSIFRSKNLLSQVNFKSGPITKSVDYTYDGPFLKSIADLNGNVTEYTYTAANPGAEDNAVTLTGANDNPIDVEIDSYWPKSQQTCIENTCYHWLTHLESDGENLAAKLQLNVFRSTNNGMPKQVNYFNFGFTGNPSKGTLDWNFMPLDDKSFIVFSIGKDVTKLGYLYQFDESTGAFRNTHLDLTHPNDQINHAAYSLYSINRGTNFIALTYKNGNNYTIKILEKEESTGSWVNVDKLKIDFITKGDSQLGDEVRNDNQGNSSIEFFDDHSNTRVSTNGNHIVIYHDRHDLLIIYRRDDQGKYSLINPKFLEKSSYTINDFITNRISDACIGEQRATKDNFCFPLNFEDEKENGGVIGDWFYLSDVNDNEGKEYQTIYKDVGNRLRMVGYFQTRSLSINYGDDNFLFYRDEGDETLRLIGNHLNYDELIVASTRNDDGAGLRCVESGVYHPSKSNFACIQTLEKYSNGEGNPVVKSFPGGYIVQAYERLGIPAHTNFNELYSNYNIKLYLIRSDWTTPGKPYLKPINKIKVNGTDVTSRIREIEYSPADGLMRVQFSDHITAGLNGACDPRINVSGRNKWTNGCKITWMGYPWKIDSEGNLDLSSTGSVFYRDFSTDENGMLVVNFENTHQFQMLSFYEINESGQKVKKVYFKTYQGGKYAGNTSSVPLSPKVVTEVVSKNINTTETPLINLVKIEYPNPIGPSPNCQTGVPLGIYPNSFGVEYSYNNFLPKHKTAVVQQCTGLGTCAMEADKSIYRFYVQGIEDDPIYNVPLGLQLLNNLPYSPEELMDGQVLQVMQCGKKNELRSLQLNQYNFAAANSWPRGVVQTYVDSSITLTKDSRGFVTRQDQKVESLDPVTRAPTITRQWTNVNGGRRLSVQTATMADLKLKLDNVESEWTFRIPTYQRQYLVPKYQGDYQSYLVSQTKSPLELANLFPNTLIPKFTEAWLPTRTQPTDAELQAGLDQSPLGPQNGSWVRVSENTRINSRHQVMESRSIPVQLGADSIYSATIFETLRSLPTAQFQNAPWLSIGYSGFEDGATELNRITNGWEFPSIFEYITTDVRSGLYSLKVKSQYGPTKDIFLPPKRANEGYVVSVWLKSNSTTAPVLRVEIRQKDAQSGLAIVKGLVSTSVPVNDVFKPNTWQRYELKLTESQIKVGGSFAANGPESKLRIWAGFANTPTSSQEILVDDFVMYPARATFSAQSFDALGRPLHQFGMDHELYTTEYAPNGEAVGTRDSRGRFFNQSFQQQPALR
jgi:hypothetical protein